MTYMILWMVAISCITLDGWNPVNNGINHLFLTGAGFLPSTVLLYSIYIVLYHITLYYIILHYTTLYYIMLYYIILHYITLYYVILYYIIWFLYYTTYIKWILICMKYMISKNLTYAIDFIHPLQRRCQVSNPPQLPPRSLRRQRQWPGAPGAPVLSGARSPKMRI